MEQLDQAPAEAAASPAPAMLDPRHSERYVCILLDFKKF